MSGWPEYTERNVTPWKTEYAIADAAGDEFGWTEDRDKAIAEAIAEAKKHNTKYKVIRIECYADERFDDTLVDSEGNPKSAEDDDEDYE